MISKIAWAWMIGGGVLLAGPSTKTQDPVNLDLEGKLEAAFVGNPQIMMAQAKIQRAEAEYRAARLEVSQHVMEAHNDHISQRVLIENLERKLQESILLRDQGMIQEADVRDNETQLIQARNVLMQIEARTRYLLGYDASAPKSSVSPKGRNQTLLVGRPQPNDGQLRPLQSKIRVAFEDMPLVQVIAHLNEHVAERNPSFTFVVNAQAFENVFGEVDDIRVNLSLDQGLTVQSVLQAIADLYPVCFVFRDYGLLVTERIQATRMASPSIPSDLPMNRGSSGRK